MNELPPLETIMPFIGSLTFGVVAGFISGYALKKVGKILAFALGLLFIAIQLLVYFGFISINWIRVQETVDPLLEPDSLNRGWQRVVDILVYNAPFAAAFIPGFLFGLAKG